MWYVLHRRTYFFYELGVCYLCSAILPLLLWNGEGEEKIPNSYFILLPYAGICYIYNGIRNRFRSLHVRVRTYHVDV